MTTAPPLALLCLVVCAACGGNDTALGDLTGTYMLDREVLAEDFLQDALRRLDSRERAALGPDARRGMLAEARSTAAESDMRLDLAADGTFVVRYRFGGEQGSRGGTWSLAGRQVTLRTTRSADGPLAKPTDLAGQVGDGLLHFAATESVPHPFTLRRR